MSTSQDRGFTLLETLVALAVSALVAAGLMSTLGRARLKSSEAGIRAEALSLAKSLLAETFLTGDIASMPRSGEGPSSKLAWRIELSRAGENFPGIQRVDVIVSWRVADRKGETRLAGHRFSPD